jgi:hypothetical protein
MTPFVIVGGIEGETGRVELEYDRLQRAAVRA